MSQVKIQTTKKGDTFAKISFDEKDLQLLTFKSEQLNINLDTLLNDILNAAIDPIEMEFQKFLLDFYNQNTKKSQPVQAKNEIEPIQTTEKENSLINKI